VHNRDTLISTIAATFAGAFSMLGNMLQWAAIYGLSLVFMLVGAKILNNSAFEKNNHYRSRSRPGHGQSGQKCCLQKKRCGLY